MNEREPNPGKHTVKYFIIFLVASGIASLFLIFLDRPDWRLLLSAYFYTFAFWLGNHRFYEFAVKKYPGFHEVRKRLAITILFILVYTLVVCLFWEGLVFQYQITFRKFIGIYIFSVLITVLISAINGAISYFELFKKSIEEKEAIKRSQIETELNVLTSQVNPHFLFNSLNTLMSLIPENSDLAVQFTQKLSEVYRYSLQGNRKDLVTLQEEIDMMEKYVFLMKIRFGENLAVYREIPNQALEFKLPVLTLQLIIENAVKHNVVSSARPLAIRIAYRDEAIEIRNNRNPKQEREPGTGTGLENIRKRYALYTDREIRITSSPDDFAIEIPLIRVLEYEGTDHRR